MIISLAQINPVIGDLEYNRAKIADFIAEAKRQNSDLVVFPELSITGYPPKDLLLKPRFIEDNLETVKQVARLTQGGPTALVGYVSRNPDPVGRPLRNTLGFLQNGEVKDEFYKSLLPTYDVFDEHRYFEPAEKSCVLPFDTSVGVVNLGITICEDLWNDKRVIPRPLYHRNPIDEVIAAGANIVINSSASPFVVNKQAFREKLLGAQAKAKSCPIVFVNQVGGNDDLIFDGGSCVFASTGAVVARTVAFREDLLTIKIESEMSGRLNLYPEGLESVWQGLVLGTRDYVSKCRFEHVVLGLSGGIDSALAATIAVEALGASHVHGVAMPSRYNSPDSLRDAEQLAKNLGIDFRVISIERLHAAFEHELANIFEGRPPDATEENIQARIRGNVLMALSNKFGWMLLTTGNKSELAVGYCTLYGDMCGGLALISDVPKTMVYQLACWYNQQRGRAVIPENSIARVPSAELRPNQTDQDSLPSYDLLDAILQLYVEEEKSAAEIIQIGFNERTVRDVLRKVDQNEYKRKQAAIGLKVTSRAFGSGRRMPIAAKVN